MINRVSSAGDIVFTGGVAKNPCMRLMILCDGLAKSLVTVREQPVHALFVGRIADIFPAQALWCIMIAVILAIVLNRHPFGDSLLFIGDNPDAARMMGIHTDRKRIGIFVLLGFFSAFAGVIDCLELSNWWPTQGEGYFLLVFAAVFIGGTSVFGGHGTIYGTLIGAIIIGIIEAGIISAGLSGFWTRLVHGFIIVLSVSLYAQMAKQKGHGSPSQKDHRKSEKPHHNGWGSGQNWWSGPP